MRRIFNHSVSLGWLLFVEMVVVLAVLLSLSRLILPFANEFRQPIAAEMENLIGHPVEIGNIEAEWNGVKPVIRLIDVKIKERNSDKPLAVFSTVFLKLNPWKSFAQAGFVPEKLVLKDSSLKFLRDTEGKIHLLGLDAKKDESVKPREPLDIKNDLEFSLENVSVAFRDERLQDDFNFRINSGDVVMGADHLRLDSRIKLPDAIGDDLHVKLISHGRLSQPETLQSEFYVRARALELKGTSFFTAEDWPQLRQGKLDTTLWGSWNMADGVNIIGDLNARDAVVTPPANVYGRASWEALKLSTRLRVTGTLDNWRLDTDRFKLETGNRVWAETGFSLAANKQNVRQRIRFNSEFLDAGELLAAMRVSPRLNDKKLAQLKAMSPHAEFEDLHTDISWGGSEPLAFNVHGQMFDASWKSHEKIPGVSGLSMAFSFDEKSGEALLEGNNSELLLPEVFDDPLIIEKLSTELNWLKTENGMVLDLEDLKLENSDVAAQGAVKLELTDAKPRLDLELIVPRLDVKAVRRYIPIKRLKNKKVGQWLQQAFTAGDATNGLFSFNGPLDMQQFKKGKVPLYAGFDIARGAVHYREEWPDIEALSGRLEFRNNGMKASVKSGKVLSTSLKKTRISINNLFRARLKIKGETAGPFDDVFDYLKQSRVLKKNQSLIEKVDSGGDVSMSLDIDLPLSKALKPRLKPVVNADVRMSGNRLALRGQDLEFNGLRGELRLRGTAFESDPLKAVFRGSEVNGMVNTDSDGTIRVDVSGYLPGGRLLPQLQSQIDAFSRGESFWNAQLQVTKEIADQPATTTLFAYSDLVGTEVLLPAPLAKTDNQRRSISVLYQFGKIPFVNVDYGDDIKFTGEFDAANNFQLIRGLIGLDKGRYSMPSSGLKVRGSWAKLSTDPWEAALAKLAELGSGKNKLEYDLVDTQFGQIDFKGILLNQSTVVAHRGNDRWIADIQSDELGGRIELPDNWRSNVPIVARLEKLHIETDDKKEKAASSGSTVQQLPAMDVVVDKFSLGRRSLGKLRLTTSQVPQGLNIDRAEVTGANYFFNASGLWSSRPGLSSTGIEFNARGSNFGDALMELGFGNSLGSGSGFLRGNLNWQGMPYQVDWASTHGDIELDIRDGMLRDVDPGLGRLIGLLSVDALPRRLNLNFRDLSEDGFQYDSLTGTATLTNGLLGTRDLKIDSTVATIDIYGETSMLNYKNRLNMDVTPNLKSTVPLAAGVIAGPQTAALIFIVDKLAESVGVDFNRTVTMKYAVTGTWGEPKIESLDAVAQDLYEDER